MTAKSAQVRRGATLAATGVSALSVVILGALVVAMLLGYRLFVVRSDSMAPAIRTGDVIVTKVQRAGAVGPGDIVTFPDPTRDSRLVTHRVLDREDGVDALDFVTRGDANGAEEHWSVAADGKLGEYKARIPGLGFTLGWFGSSWARFVVLAALASAVAGVTLRRIWAW